MEERDLMNDLKDLPRNSVVRKINELVKRVRLCKVHAYIIGHLKEQMPLLMGHAKTQKKLLEDMPSVFRSVMKKYNLAPGDFPELIDFKSKLQEHDFSKFSPIKLKLIESADNVLGVEFPRLMQALPRATDVTFAPKPVVGNADPSAPMASADNSNPFGDGEGTSSSEWALANYVDHFLPQFNQIQQNGFVSGAAAKPLLSASKLPVQSLRKIWELSDLDKDGQLDQNEFVVALYLIEYCKLGNSLPDKLDESWIPPGK
jgi:EH domain-containing protein 1